MYENVFSRLLFLLPPERAHGLALALLRMALAIPPTRSLLQGQTRVPDLEVELFGLRFRNPIGLAAGFDKNALHVDLMVALGFGFIEIGSVTARSWAGNPKPRLFRLRDDLALLNRMGLGNEGAEAIAARLASLRRDRDARAPETSRPDVPIFVNVAKTPVPSNEADGIADYVASTERVTPVADAVVLNVSCPNTDDGRTFEDPDLLGRLLAAVREVIPVGEDGPSLLVKLSGDQERSMLAESVRVVDEYRVDGLVAINTSIDRRSLTPEGSRSGMAIGAGGLSGTPIRERARETVAFLSEATGGRLPIVGVGGVFGPEDARALMDAGASLVELYTGMVYRGPTIVRRIREGLGSVSVGAPARVS